MINRWILRFRPARYKSLKIDNKYIFYKESMIIHILQPRSRKKLRPGLLLQTAIYMRAFGFVRVFVFACKCVPVRALMYVCVSVFVCTFARTFTCKFACKFVSVYVSVLVCMCLSVC